jgi:hypothetical protein
MRRPFYAAIEQGCARSGRSRERNTWAMTGSQRRTKEVSHLHESVWLETSFTSNR